MEVHNESTEGDPYAGFLDTFASDIGSTLDDLVSDWTESENEVGSRNIQTDSGPPSIIRTRTSMDSLEGMTDLSLRKARPLAFANPVYDLVNLGGVVVRARQMTLIPLSQFDINKQPDDSSKQGKHKHSKRGSHGFINKLTHLTKRKHHSVKKNEPEMDVTAPLWTDHATVSFREHPRSASLHRTPSTDYGEGNIPKIEDKPKPRPASLELENAEDKATIKVPPTKVPRSAKGSFTPVSPIKEIVPIINQPDNVFETERVPQSNVESTEEVVENENNNKLLRSGESTTSLASDISEEAVEENTKTMMEVMHEIEDDDSSKQEENMTRQIDQQDKNVEGEQQGNQEHEEDEPLLKRNKTLKWSGSRAAPALIREFTKKSKKSGRQMEIVSTDSPDTGESPAKTSNETTANVAQQSSDITQQQNIDGKTRLLQTNVSKNHSSPATPKMRDASAFTILSSLLPPAPKLRRTESTKIRMYIHKMGTNAQNALGYATTQFVTQTMQSSEDRPVVLLHSIRSFLTDIKKYLISNPHVGFMNKIQKIVKHSHITDVEGAIDDALERLVLYPLRDYIYKRLVIDYARTGKIRMVEDAIKVGKTKSPQELGIRATLIPPNEEALITVRHHFSELQATYSPYYKLKHLLSAVTTIYENTTDLSCEDQSARKIGADDFLPLLVHAIIKCDFTAADIEAHYIDGLLDPTLLLGEGGYYLTTLISAVQVLSSMKKRETPLPNIADLQGFLKVGISSNTEKHINAGKSPTSQPNSGSSGDVMRENLLLHKTLHVPPSMTSHNLGMMIAKKYGIKNTKDFCLHVVVNGVAYPLKPQEFPQLVKMDLMTQFQPRNFFFVYRQIDKTPENPSERPVTIDTEHLKVNTEQGEHLTPEKDVAGGSETATKEVFEDSESGKESSTGEISSDDLPPPPPHNISSPGFADMPLPDAFFHQDVMPPPSPDATEDIPPPPPDDTLAPSDDILPPPDVIISPNAMPSPANVTSSSSDTTVLPPDTLDSESNATVEIKDDVHPPTEDRKISLDATVTQPNAIPLPSTDDTDSAYDVTLEQPDATSTSSTQDEAPKTPEHDSPDPKKYSTDSSEADTSSEDIQMDESYQSATLVDDVLTPVRKMPSRPKPPRKQQNVATNITKQQKEEIQNIAIVIPVPNTDTQTPSSNHDSNSGEVESKNLEIQTSDVPYVTLTDVTEGAEHELETLSDISSVSDGRRSAGCHSDSYYGTGDHGDGRNSSRGYYSDGHQVDETQTSSKATDLGATASVSALKNFFEDEISKVSEDAAKLAPSHSPSK